MTDTADAGPSKEERILHAVRAALSKVIRDTATPPHMRHPLSAETIEELRLCLTLISARERELAAVAGQTWNERPRYADDPAKQTAAVVRFHKPAEEAPPKG